ncbi:hypothetical protein As57867_006069, partial [Aphanomyces stellatus]
MSFRSVYNGTSDAIHGFIFSAPRAFIHPDTSGAIKASVVFSADTQALVDAFHVQETLEDAIRHVKVGFHIGSSASGNYVLDVFVPPNSVQHVANDGAGDVVVDSGVLASDDRRNVHVEATKSGSVFVSDNDITLRHLTLSSSGSGSIQVSVKAALNSSQIDL